MLCYSNNEIENLKSVFRNTYMYMHSQQVRNKGVRQQSNFPLRAFQNHV